MPNQWNPLLDIGGVACNIFTGQDGQDGHLAESTAIDGGRKATVRFKCAWEDRNDLIAGLVGTVDYNQGTIVRTDPFAYPLAARDDRENAGAGNKMFAARLFATSCPTVEGIKWHADPEGVETGLAGWGAFDFAVVTAEFTSAPYLIQPLLNPEPAFNDLSWHTYCVSKLRVSGEVFSPPTGSYKWAEGTSAGQPVQDAHVGLIRPRYELSVTRVRMPIVPCKTLDSMIGTVNKTTIKVGANTVSPDAAMFMGYNLEPYADPYSGGIVFNIELLWLINGFVAERNADGSWNWFVDPGGEWSGIIQSDRAANPGPPFAEAEHNDLFSDTIA